MIACMNSGSIPIAAYRPANKDKLMIFLFLITGLVFAGCSTKIQVTKVGAQLEPTNPEIIEVYDIDTEVGSQY
jgi:hypothetical protein